MHILAGESALRALRAVRYRNLSVALPEISTDSARAYLPGQDRDEDEPDPEPPDPFSSGQTLEDVAFAFDQVETNAHIDCWRLGDIGKFTADQPLELAVFSRNRRISQKRSFSHPLSRTLPESALVQVDHTLYFECPELIVLHMARSLGVVGLAQLIMELCGSYALEPCASPWRQCNYHASPVTTIARIRAYSAHVRTRGHTAKLHKALELAMEGAASPAETNLALMLSMPPEMGGYGFAKPLLNAKLKVPEDEIDNVGGTSYKLDLFWQDAYTDLEYESDEFHLSPEIALSFVSVLDKGAPQGPQVFANRYEYLTKASADRCRMRDIQYLGISVVPVVSYDLRSVKRLDQVARALARNFERNALADTEAWLEALDEFDYRHRENLLLELKATSGELDLWSVFSC